MKSSDNRRYENGFLSNGPLYSLLVLYMPLTTLAAVIFLLNALLPAFLPSALLIAAGVVSGLSASLYSDFMKDIKSSRFAANIRGGIIITVFCYVSASLFQRGIPWREMFLPNLLNITASLSALYVWADVLSLKQLFSARRRFEVYTEQYSGRKLQEAIFEDSSLLQYVNENIDKIKRNYFIQLALIGVLALICSINGISLSLSIYFLLAVILSGGICIFGLFGIIDWEHYYAGEGIALSSHDRTDRILAMALFSLLCFTGAVLPASDKSLLPFSLITGFLAWFLSLFRRRLSPLEETVYPENSADADTDMGSLPFPFEEAAPSPLWQTISKFILIILKYGFILLAAAGFIRFMISPLLNRGKVSRETTFLRRLIRITAEWFSGVLSAFVSFFADPAGGKTRLKLRKFRDTEVLAAAENIFGAYSQAKERDMRRSVTLFARLIIWGGQARHVEWKPSLAPGEYCAILAAASPPAAEGNAPEGIPDLQKQNEGIIRCGELFEQALYSAEVLCKEEQKEFKNLVEEITSTGA